MVSTAWRLLACRTTDIPVFAVGLALMLSVASVVSLSDGSAEWPDDMGVEGCVDDMGASDSEFQNAKVGKQMLLLCHCLLCLFNLMSKPLK